MSAGEMQNVYSTLTSENLGNNSDIELRWAMKASDHAEVYFNLITSVEPRILRLTALDNEIYTKFRETFPDLKVDVLDEKELKSAESKEKWREFCEYFKEKVEDYNFGTLLRLNCKEDYSQENSIFCVRVQFLAIEIARNREGYNDELRYTHGKLTKPSDQRS
ncbi:protein PBDC1-like isoform X3 [Pomacea canaliculata]|uniref:protein PBDC1-like isoform X3 n=1 Tax=Pomacea canaliculata TaxID=400727 RepID=UPI000D73572D|nr:protein PBDC1-like isoform X3 [Pomacea canaliculata]